jgi:uncharacterized protein (TIGR03435 family)
LAVSGWVLFAVARGAGQTEARAPEFEVASVKQLDAKDSKPMPNLPSFIQMIRGFEGGPGSKDPGRINYHDVTLKMVLAHAYDCKPERISGPDWIDSERYTIVAKLAPDTTREQLRMMLQKLLTERFQMTVHREAKEMPVYWLKVAKRGAKLAPPEVIPEYKTEEERIAANQARMAAMRKRNEEEMAKRRAAAEESAGRGVGHPGSSRSFGNSGATLDGLAETLSSYVDRPVKNMTELEGKYSFRVEWSPDGQTDGAGLPRPDIFKALEEQLGLRLESGKDQVESLVVEKAAKVPTSN